MVVPPAPKTNPYGNRVLLCGNIHVSKDWKISLLLTLVIISSVGFTISSVIDYGGDATNNSNNTGRFIAWIIVACINGILGVAVFVNLWLSVLVEPGIIPPQSYYDVTNKTNPDPVPPNFEDLTVDKWSRKVTVTSADGQSSMEYDEQICRSCKIWRPPRSGHCFQEDCCIEEFDHKCTVIGASIGKRNFGYFYMFNLLGSILCFVAMATVVASFVETVQWDKLTKPAETHADRMNQWRVAAGVIVIIEAISACMFTIQFAVRYTRYSCLNLTAKDEWGWRAEAKELAQMQRAGKGDCAVCVDRSCNVRLPPSNVPY